MTQAVCDTFSSAISFFLSRLSSLQHLELSFDRDSWPRDLSSCISALTNLTRLQMAGDPTGSTNDVLRHLLPLTDLAELELSSCRQLSIPRELSRLPLLTRLDLRGSHPAGSSRWQHLELCSQLSYLSLSRCSLRDSDMPQLGGLSQLRTLLLCANRWSALPAGLDAATALEALDLSHTDLATCSLGWEQLLCLPELSSSDLRGCFVMRDALPPPLCTLRQKLPGLTMHVADTLYRTRRARYPLYQVLQVSAQALLPVSMCRRIGPSYSKCPLWCVLPPSLILPHGLPCCSAAKSHPRPTQVELPAVAQLAAVAE
jgi:hypothetical protein